MEAVTELEDCGDLKVWSEEVEEIRLFSVCASSLPVSVAGAVKSRIS